MRSRAATAVLPSSRRPLLCAVLLWLCLLFFLLPTVVQALEALQGDKPVAIEADNIAYDEERDVVTASGNVVVRYEGNTLTADTVALDRKTNIATAEGNVVLRGEKDMIEGARAVFNTQNRRGVVYQGKMFLAENHFYLEGTTIEKRGEETYRATDAAMTTCDGDVPDWRIRSSEMDVTADGYGTLKHGKFYVSDVPILIGSGLRPDSIDELLSIADGAIVGSTFKIDGKAENCVDPKRVDQMMAAVERVRRN